MRVLQDLPRGVRAGAAGDAATRMRAGARQVQPVEHEPVARLAVQGTPHEELIQAGLGVVDVPAVRP